MFINDVRLNKVWQSYKMEYYKANKRQNLDYNQVVLTSECHCS